MAADATPAGGKVLQTVSGHSNTFMQVTDTHIWKLTDAPERDMLVTLMDCPELKDIVPTFTREVPLEQFIGKEPSKDAVVVELQDVTSGFGKDPCIMDVKLGTAPGTRTFLEDEVDNPKVRADLLKKMDALDSTEATQAERESGGITKLRYMQFRERTSTSSALGFRLEGLVVADIVPQTDGEASGSQLPRVQLEVPSKEALSTISTEAGIEAQLHTFIRGDAQLKERYLQRLRAIHSTLSACRPFSEHQFINSSLLFVHDAARQRCGVWMIDFSKARPAKAPLTHMADWQLGNQEDGYLFGLTNMIRIWEGIPVNDA